LEVWLSAEKRRERWKQRREGAIPKNLGLSYSNVKSEPLYEQLQSEIGALSDFSVHFTPEYFWRYYELIFRVFDRCENGRMLRHPDVERAHAFVLYQHEKFHGLAKPAIEALISSAVP
jgi:hypothetical protein